MIESIVMKLRHIVEMAQAVGIFSASRGREFICHLFERVSVDARAQKMFLFFRWIYEHNRTLDNFERTARYKRVNNEYAVVPGDAERKIEYKRRVFDVLHSREKLKRLYLILVKCVEFAGASAVFSRQANFARRVLNSLSSHDKLKRGAVFAVVIHTACVAGEFILARFLRSLVELRVKSKITREVVVESRLQ
jgi:hypothetical protein